METSELLDDICSVRPIISQKIQDQIVETDFWRLYMASPLVHSWPLVSLFGSRPSDLHTWLNWTSKYEHWSGFVFRQNFFFSYDNFAFQFWKSTFFHFQMFYLFFYFFLPLLYNHHGLDPCLWKDLTVYISSFRSCCKNWTVYWGMFQVWWKGNNLCFVFIVINMSQACEWQQDEQMSLAATVSSEIWLSELRCMLGMKPGLPC